MKRPRGERAWIYRLSCFIVWTTLKVWERFKVEGAEHVPATGGCLIAANHVSFLDPPVVAVGVPHRQVHFMARDTLFRTFIGRWYLTGVGTMPIDRTKGDVGALRKAISVVKEGKVLGLFPEGTRSPDGKLREAKGGIGFIIAKAGVPVVPAYVSGTFHALPKHARRLRRGGVTVRYGRAMPFSEFAPLCDREDGYTRIGQLVMSRIAALAAEKRPE